MYTGDMFTVTEADELLQKEGIAADLKAIHAQWEKNIAAVLETATLKKPANGFMQSGSQKGVHTEHLGFILTEMQYLQRAYPDAKW
jgi:ring-1,2-phenylacetyl-CoA epoxidase subunit PaaC